VLADVGALIEVATFRFDGQCGVRPSRLEPCDPQLALYRLAAPSPRSPSRTGPARRDEDPGQAKQKRDDSSRTPFVSLLGELTAERDDESPEELELRERAERVRLHPIPGQDLIDWVGGGTPATFDGIGRINAFELMMYCRMKPTDRILEPGCGCGRNAKWIAPHLDPRAGAFHGFDIYRPAIDWATRNITAHYPNVVFEFADIANTNYNPQGKVAPHEYVFPFDDESFDLVFLPSVFTHMTDESFLHYTREIRRVLRPGGLLLSWHFLLNDVSRDLVRSGASTIDMQPFDEVSWARYPDNPCAAIAFDERYVLRTYESMGLRPQHVIHGSWCGGQAEGYKDYQDMVLARKREP
jgi:SAM-dependent methyltransferase